MYWLEFSFIQLSPQHIFKDFHHIALKLFNFQLLNTYKIFLDFFLLSAISFTPLFPSPHHTPLFHHFSTSPLHRNSISIRALRFVSCIIISALLFIYHSFYLFDHFVAPPTSSCSFLIHSSIAPTPSQIEIDSH